MNYRTKVKNRPFIIKFWFNGSFIQLPPYAIMWVHPPCRNYKWTQVKFDDHNLCKNAEKGVTNEFAPNILKFPLNSRCDRTTMCHSNTVCCKRQKLKLRLEMVINLSKLWCYTQQLIIIIFVLRTYYFSCSLEEQDRHSFSEELMMMK